MTVEEKGFLENLKNSEAAVRVEMEQMKNLLLQAGLDVAGGTTGFGKGGGKGKGDERGRALLNRKDFNLVDKFEGSQSKFKSWLFDLITALGSVDQELTRQIKDLLKSRPKIVMNGNDWEVPNNMDLGDELGEGPSKHTKYKGELYALIVGLTTGEAKCVVRGISEKGWEADGFLALMMLQARYDANTAASLMQCVMEVVNPPGQNTTKGYSSE